jgi:hypothetical protein
VSWSGDASEVLNPIYVTMTANKSVTANFGYPLSVVKAGIGLYILKNCLLKSKISNCPTQRAQMKWEVKGSRRKGKESRLQGSEETAISHQHFCVLCKSVERVV